MSNRTRNIENLIQGVSQQAAQQRRDSQCEEQFDCINSPKDGCMSRNGFELIAFHPNGNLTGGFCYEIFRGITEHYLAIIVGTTWIVYNLETGEVCTQSDTSGSAYRSITTGTEDRNVWRALTVDDTTFLANTTIAPQMLPDVEPARPSEAMFFFKAGAYQTRFAISLTYDGVHHQWEYTTPDNSSPGNAEFIDTGQLAATFYRAMAGSAANNAGPGVGGVFQGETGGAGLGGVASILNSSGVLPGGFDLKINGNLLHLFRIDGAPFDVDMTDGAGNTLTEAFKDTARSFSDLPKGGFEGLTLRIKGLKTEAADDYYVRFSSNNADGFWEETVAPSTRTSLNPDTMPHALVNTGLNTFEWRRLSWSSRIAGDEDTAPDPRFVGRRIEDLFYHKKRLGILTEVAGEWSKSKNPYTHFPDTVQTVLATARISIDLSTGGAIALPRKAIEIDESLYIWAQGVQFRVSNGQDVAFKEETAEAPTSTFYEFAERANFGRVGSTLYFATEPGDHATVRNLVFQNGKPAGDVDVTAHVPDYIPSGVRRLSTSDTQRCLLIQSDGAPDRLYLYNYLLQDKSFVQSAWNTWRLPAGTILWSSIYRSDVYVALQRTDGIVLLRSSLKASHVDEGHQYHTRMDLRIDEGQVTVVYDPLVNETRLDIPFSLSEEPGDIRVVIRTTSGETIRGQHFPVKRKEGILLRTLVVDGDLTGMEFYVGIRVRTERLDSEFFLRTEKGVLDTDGITLMKYRTYHDRTGYYRIEVDGGANRMFVTEYPAGSAGLTGSILGQPPGLGRGYLETGIGVLSADAKVRLVNDSVFPSRWQSAVYTYRAVVRSTPDGG